MQLSQTMINLFFNFFLFIYFVDTFYKRVACKIFVNEDMGQMYKCK